MPKIWFLLVGQDSQSLIQRDRTMREPIGFFNSVRNGHRVQVHVMKFTENYSPRFG